MNQIVDRTEEIHSLHRQARRPAHVEPSVLPHSLSKRKDPQHADHVVAIHVDHDLEELQVSAGAGRGQRIGL